jgi:RNA polymerase sigma-70 factor (ECF subfamily)
LPVQEKIISLLNGCIKNDRASQKELYHLLADYAMSVCYRYAESHEEAEELVNESFIKLFKNIQKFESNRYADTFTSLKGWFKRILINTCIDQFRKNKHNAMTHTLPEEFDIPAENQATAIDQISYKEIIDSIRQLSPAYRNVFNLFVIEGYSHEDIADHLGISVGTSKSNLSKAREKMKKLLLQLTRYKAYA